MKAKPKKKKEKQPFHFMVSENIEALAIAIVMALILNQFIIQAYKIPTGSMQPVIMGDERQGLFDRILVNKFVYLVSDPERWDIIVFKYPLNQSLNYIKRLVGLPGETIGIEGGDILVNGTIERKPENAVSAVLKEVYPNGKSMNGYFETDGEVRMNHGVVFKAPGKVATRESIKDEYLDGYDPDYHISKPPGNMGGNFVGDVRLAFTARLDSAGGGIRVRIREDGKEHIFFLRGEKHDGSSYLASQPFDLMQGQGEERVWTDPDLSLSAGEEYDLVFSNIDDRLSLWINGDEVVRHDYDYDGNERRHRGNRVEFGLTDTGGEFTDIRLYRDIYYIGGKELKEWKVPEDHFFALGDNTQTSADGRLWNAVVLETRDGRSVMGDYHIDGMPNARTTPDGYRLIDHFGDPRELARTEVVGKPRTQRTPFVSRNLMLGKAMVIFWPVYPHFRWNILR